MKRIAVMLLLLLAVAAAEEVSLNRAATLAVVEFPNLETQPQSIPSQLAVTDSGSYWIVEFDGTWVPVTREGEVLKEEEEEIKAAYRVHYALKKVVEQRDSDQYPTTKDMSLTLMLGDIEGKETYLVSYRSQLPTELQGDADELVAAAQALKASVQGSINAITMLRARENEVLYSPADYAAFESWRGDFNSLMSSFQQVAAKGYAYDDGRTAFNLAAQDFLNQSTDATENQIVQAFASGISISNIPGSLPGLEGTVSQWKVNWLDVTLTDAKINKSVGEIYIIYQEFYSGETVDVLQQQAYEKVQGLAVTVPLIVGDLMQCEDDLSAREQTDLHELNETYERAVKSYNEGADWERAREDGKARTAYLNAVSYAEDAAELEAGLRDVECPRATPKPPGGDTLMDFLTSGWGIAFIVLVLLLVGLYVWNSRKKEETYDEGEYVPDW
ncbi:MAG: hypothetical protein KAW41_03705 [Candidatus Diapherotrites archaeon]|nr:hypothetical protein [Candidatus Diapherotrites archaeon]